MELKFFTVKVMNALLAKGVKKMPSFISLQNYHKSRLNFSDIVEELNGSTEPDFDTDKFIKPTKFPMNLIKRLLKKPDFNANTSNKIFEGVDIVNVTFHRFNFSYTIFRNCRMKNVTFIDCSMYGADFSEAISVENVVIKATN